MSIKCENGLPFAVGRLSRSRVRVLPRHHCAVA